MSEYPKIYRNGKLVSKSLIEHARDGAPYVISDSMEPTLHHATGRLIGSKREFSKETRSAGCVELGNEPIKPRLAITLDRGQRREAIRKSIYDLRNGR